MLHRLSYGTFLLPLSLRLKKRKSTSHPMWRGGGGGGSLCLRAESKEISIFSDLWPQSITKAESFLLTSAVLFVVVVVISYIPGVMTCLRVVMNRPERWSRSAGQQGAESCTITLYAGLSTCGVSPPRLTSPPLGPDQSINASQAAVLLLRSPSASLHSAYSRLAGLISKLHPVPRLQAAAAACEPSVEPGLFV